MEPMRCQSNRNRKPNRSLHGRKKPQDLSMRSKSPGPKTRVRAGTTYVMGGPIATPGGVWIEFPRMSMEVRASASEFLAYERVAASCPTDTAASPTDVPRILVSSVTLPAGKHRSIFNLERNKPETTRKQRTKKGNRFGEGLRKRIIRRDLTSGFSNWNRLSSSRKRGPIRLRPGPIR